MSRYRWTLLKHSEQWTILRSNGEQTEAFEVQMMHENMAPVDWAETLASRLFTVGYDGSGLLMAIDSKDCLAVNVPIDPSTKSNGRRAVTYELEKYFPLPAEEFTVDYLENPNDTFAIAVETVNFQPLLRSLEDKGVFVQSIVPSAFIVARSLAKQVFSSKSWDNQKDHALLWSDIDYTECVLFNSGNACCWYHFDKRANTLPRMLQARAAKTGRSIVVHVSDMAMPFLGACEGCSSIIIEVIEDPPKSQIHSNSKKDFSAMVALEASEILAGKTITSIDLCREALAATDRYRFIRRPMQFAMLGAIAILLALRNKLIKFLAIFFQSCRRCFKFLLFFLG